MDFQQSTQNTQSSQCSNYLYCSLYLTLQYQRFSLPKNQRMSLSKIQSSSLKETTNTLLQELFQACLKNQQMNYDLDIFFSNFVTQFIFHYVQMIRILYGFATAVHFLKCFRNFIYSGLKKISCLFKKSIRESGQRNLIEDPNNKSKISEIILQFCNTFKFTLFKISWPNPMYFAQMFLRFVQIFLTHVELKEFQLSIQKFLVLLQQLSDPALSSQTLSCILQQHAPLKLCKFTAQKSIIISRQFFSIFMEKKMFNFITSPQGFWLTLIRIIDQLYGLLPQIYAFKIDAQKMLVECNKQNIDVISSYLKKKQFQYRSAFIFDIQPQNQGKFNFFESIKPKILKEMRDQIHLKMEQKPRYEINRIQECLYLQNILLKQRLFTILQKHYIDNKKGRDFYTSFKQIVQKYSPSKTCYYLNKQKFSVFRISNLESDIEQNQDQQMMNSVQKEIDFKLSTIANAYKKKVLNYSQDVNSQFLFNDFIKNRRKSRQIFSALSFKNQTNQDRLNRMKSNSNIRQTYKQEEQSKLLHSSKIYGSSYGNQYTQTVLYENPQKNSKFWSSSQRQNTNSLSQRQSTSNQRFLKKSLTKPALSLTRNYKGKKSQKPISFKINSQLSNNRFTQEDRNIIDSFINHKSIRGQVQIKLKR